MTAQAYEKIYINGEKYSMATQPLDSLMDDRKVKLITPSTALWRGYIGTWELRNNKLYLISGVFHTPWGERGLEYIFRYSNPVFAGWYTGNVRVIDGEILNYVHGGHLSTFETDIYLHFYKGLFTKKTVVNNTMKRFNNSTISFDGEF